MMVATLAQNSQTAPSAAQGADAAPGEEANTGAATSADQAAEAEQATDSTSSQGADAAPSETTGKPEAVEAAGSESEEAVTSPAASQSEATTIEQAAPPATSIDASLPLPATPAGDGMPAEGQQTALPVDELAQLNKEQGVFWMGLIPIIALGFFILVWAVVSYWRQKKNWQELGKDLELSDEPALSKSDQSFFSSPSPSEMSRLPETQQSERLSKKKNKKDDED